MDYHAVISTRAPAKTNHLIIHYDLITIWFISDESCIELVLYFCKEIKYIAPSTLKDIGLKY